MADDSNVQFSEREALLFHSRRSGPARSRSSPPSRWRRSATSALAYSPGVAVPVRAIADDPATRL